MQLLILLMMLICAPVYAQQNAPHLVAEVDGKTETIRLSRMDTEVRILGESAETRMTLTFYNPHSRELEGKLYFPLPEGVTVSGYALDINGAMIDGVVVEKHQGRRIFEKEARKRVDPGLVEWVTGNNFQTRVYPIPSEGTRTVMVRYISQLSRVSGQASYHLPFNLPGKVDQFHLRVEVVRAAAIPRMTKGSFSNFEFSAWNDSYVAEISLKGIALKEDLIIGIPEVEKTPVWVEKNGDDVYFAIHDFQAASFKPRNRKSRPPKRITIFWDASGSRGNKDHQRELSLLEMLFKGWNRATVEVDLVLFRNTFEPSRHFTVIGGEAGQLLDELRRVAYDGGTQLPILSPSVPTIIPDYCVLFTDGIANFGHEVPTNLRVPLYGISNDPASNHAFLSWLAMETGGQYFNLAEMEDKTVLDNIGLPVYQFMSARYDPASVTDTYPRNPEPVQGRFTLTGKLLKASAEIRLEFGIGGRVRKVVKYTVNRKDALQGNLLPIFWAQKRVKELSIFPESNRKELIETGKRHGLVTPGTSLLVLETLQQYVQHRIEPPASLPDFRKEYLEQIAEQPEEKEQSNADKMDRILSDWSKRVKWWETDFSVASVKPVKEAAPKQDPAPPTPERYVTLEPQRDFRSAARTEANSPPETVAAPRSAKPKPPIVASIATRNGRSVLYGTAIDTSGAVLPGAHITAINTETGVESRTACNNVGTYNITGLQPGVYKVIAEMNGFNTATVVDVSLREGSRRQLNFELAVAGVATEIEVFTSAENLLLESGSAVETALEDTNGVESIAISGWNPETPYLQELENTPPGQYLQVYLRNRESNKDSPAFFLDCADFFLKRNQRAIGLRILSNIAELQLENPSFLRILAHRLAEMGEIELSAQLFESVLKMRPEEPQSYRDLALVLAEQKKYPRAIELLNHVVMNRWDRFDGIEVIALMELNRIIPLARAQGITGIPVEPRMIKPLDADIRVVLTWDADMTDIDLWVTEPSGTKAYYGAPVTKDGGLVSEDFTEGYGPEEYIIRHAKPGKYLIQVDFYGSNTIALQGPVTVQADVYTNYGRQNEKRQRLTLRLREKKETFMIGEITF